tara:strand:- start:417 stop:1376 length:960 start_codon:yes stop_codon:yes gene_type:complete
MRSTLFPVIEPRACGYLTVSELHKIYWEEMGNPSGVPVLFLHGGPGAGIAPIHRRFFDPCHYRIILFDQRGAGKSKPTAECRENTTQDLIKDIEKLRRHLKIDGWLVFGGSWGSTLAIAYGESNPDSCLGFVLRGVFLGQEWEIEWFMNGMGTFFPEAKRKFLSLLSETERQNPLSSYMKLLNHSDPDVYFGAAAAWNEYEQSCSTLKPAENRLSISSTFDQMLCLARLEAHYFINRIFIEKDELIKHIGKITNKPAVIIQGRYDVVCPIYSADKLAMHWPRAKYKVIEDAGHSAMEPGIKMALVRATEYMKEHLKDLP